jgi:hypothetical protein
LQVGRGWKLGYIATVDHQGHSRGLTFACEPDSPLRSER